MTKPCFGGGGHPGAFWKTSYSKEFCQLKNWEKAYFRKENIIYLFVSISCWFAR